MKIVHQVRQDGFATWRCVAPELSTFELAAELGEIIKMSELVPASTIPNVQSLIPRKRAEGRKNQYSGIYGLTRFPLHTDLAHWAVPPHYILLRCIVGSTDVFTNLLDWSYIINASEESLLRKAIFTTRKARDGHSALFRALSQDGPRKIFRWDPLFLKPLNEQARAVASLMRNLDGTEKVANILLEQPGDILLIDNWRMLHARTEVMAQSITRHIQRAYLSEIFE